MTKSEIKKIIRKMTLDQKVGQCLTFGFSGSIVTDDFLDALTRFHCGGLRLSPYSNNFEYKTKPTRKQGELRKKGTSHNKMLPVSIAPYLTPAQYAGLIDQFQDIAKKRNCGVPLHISVDQEGDLSADIVKGGVALFPSQMGMAATGDKKLVETAAGAIARQLRNYGVNMTHAPVVDVNVLPDNVECDTRSFSDSPKRCAEYAQAMVRGYQQNGVIATAKHFPGRGNSNVDAHDEMPVIEGDLEEFMKRDLIPYKLLIKNGVDAVMLAHTIYPGLDPDRLLSTVSPNIVTGLLRNRMGFDGVVTTDSITMAALVEEYGVAKGAALAIKAGCDLVLMKEESAAREEMFLTIKDYVKKGSIPKDQLDTSVFRILRMKAKRKLFAAPSASKSAAVSFPDSNSCALAKKVAEKSMVVAKNKDRVVPTGKSKRIYLIEQVFCDRSPNDMWNHPRKLYEILLSKGFNVPYRTEVEYRDYAMGGTGETVDPKKVLKYIDKKDYDVVLVTSVFYRNYHTDTKLTEDIIRKSRKPVIVVTNTPYPAGCPKNAKNLIINFASSPSGFDALTDVLSGKKKAKGKLPLSKKIRAAVGLA